MAVPVIAIFDIGKTNKKLFLFDEGYRIVFEKNDFFAEIKDEDGEPCEDLQKLTDFINDTVEEVFSKPAFDIKAINFSAYGASLVYIDENAKPLTPLYNYLKKYPAELQKKFYEQYGGENDFSLRTASPVLGSLNAGMQLYRIKNEQPEIFHQIKWALHLPQFLSWLIVPTAVSDITSIGCHTNFWNFQKNGYDEWVSQEKMQHLLAPIVPSNAVHLLSIHGKNILAGVGLHDSSAALIPYLTCFSEPFVLISTGTWCISLNPFNNTSLTIAELKQDCLCYLTHEGQQVKASRLFSGYEHEQQIKKLSSHYDKPLDYYRTVTFDANFSGEGFDENDLSLYPRYEEAYHHLVSRLVRLQHQSTQLVLNGAPVKRIFVDGGFSKNDVYMHLLARVFPGIAIFAASVPQASAIGAAMAIHEEWNTKKISENLIALKPYAIQKKHSSI